MTDTERETEKKQAKENDNSANEEKAYGGYTTHGAAERTQTTENESN